MSNVEVVNVSLPLPKESKEVADLLDAILEKVLAKAEMMEYTELIGQLTTAVDGAQKISAEMKSQYRNELGAYLAWKLSERLAPDGSLDAQA